MHDLIHVLLVSRNTVSMYLCRRIQPSLLAPYHSQVPPPGANQSRLRKQRDSKSPTRFSPRWVVPYIGYIGMCRAKGYAFFSCFGRSEIGHQCRPFWSEIGYGLCTLVLNWVCFLEELATSSSFGDKTISLLMFTPTTVYVP